MKAPVLVASADGVGTKLKIAFLTGRHDTVGRDLVNHCVNDILVQGARPLFFLDYVATGVLAPEVIVSIVEGVARGCRENGCALLGGETAEMPGFYAAGEYDVAGFIVGIVEREKVIDGSRIAPGDVLLALPSAGLHTNGYSLARKLFFEVAGHAPDTHLEALGTTVGEALLAPHLSYLRPLEGLLDTGLIKGLAHITGGGLAGQHPAHPARRHRGRNQARLVARARRLPRHAGDRQRLRRGDAPHLQHGRRDGHRLRTGGRRDHPLSLRQPRRMSPHGPRRRGRAHGHTRLRRASRL